MSGSVGPAGRSSTSGLRGRGDGVRVVVEGYDVQRRRLRAMRRQLADHPHPLDPDHPAFYDEDVDALERELDEAFS